MMSFILLVKLSVIQCTILQGQEIKTSFWPSGPYAIPTPIDGCPESYLAGWTEGYVNITTQVPLEIWITQYVFSFDDDPGEANQINVTSMFNIAEDKLHIPYTLGPYSPYTFQFNFCYKSKEHANNSMDAWPPGTYSIYGTKDGCPLGFAENYITLTLSEVMSLSRDGDLPLMEISLDSKQVNIRLLMCKRIEDASQNDSLFMAITPFILVKGNDDNCAIFKGFNVTSESLDIAGKDKNDFTHTVIRFVLHHCYYTPVDYIEKSLDESGLSYMDAFNTCQSIVSFRMYFQEGYEKVFSLEYENAFNSINIHSYGFSVKDAVKYVSAFEGTYRVPWLLFDLKMTKPIHALFIMLSNDLDGNEMDENDYPDAFVSNDQWSFLNHGAVLGRAITYRYMPTAMAHVFLKRIAGRYLSIVATQYKTNTVVMKLFLKMKRFYILTKCGDDIYEFKNVCHRELGMLDNIIKDFQLSASSWQHDYPPTMARQYLAGWCADTTYVKPYIQVDLIAPTTINGIAVINGYTEIAYEQQREFIRKTVPLGCKSFRVQYGTNLDSFKEYNTVFKLDLSLPYTQPQTKIFRKQFLARYVRIYPEALPNSNNIVCIRLELLGCAKTVIYSKQCDNNSVTFPANTTSSPVSITNTTFDIGDVGTPTWADCFNLCKKAAANCSSFLFNNADCRISAPSETFKFITYEVVNEDEILTTKTCVADIGDYKLTEQLFADKRRFAEINPDNLFPIIEPGVFTSVGYPYHYFTDQLYIWNITLEDNAYITLIFSNISLHAYKGVAYDSVGECIDVIEVRNGLEDGEALDIIDDIIDYRRNGATPTIATAYTTVFVVWRTCYRISQKSKTGNGFRAIVQKDIVPNCFGRSGAECYKEEMTLGSHSYLGLPQPSVYTWIIYIIDIRIIIITFVDFDVNCKMGAGLTISLSVWEDLSFCNTNRPLGPIKSVYNNLKIQYSPPNGDYQFYDGFYAEYSPVKINPVLLKTVSSMTVNPMLDVLTHFDDNVEANYAKICSEVFKTCYSIYPSSSRSWQEASGYCLSQGKVLASIHSQFEFQLLHHALFNFTYDKLLDYQRIRDSYANRGATEYFPLFYSYIGLRRYTGEIGQQKEFWEDGTPLTFTAWRAQEPADVQKKHCTRMGFNLQNKADTWETTYCDIIPEEAVYFICEESHNSFNANRGLRNDENTLVPTSEIADNMFKCDDGIWISPLSVCDGFPDCPDWSDETKCTDVQKDEELFLCNDGRYIHISYICNYIQDCYDISDEFCEFSTCKSSEFRCDNMQCIARLRACDGVLDCLDGSDERNCDRCNDTVAFRCGDLSCKPKSLVCDNHADCSDASDELGCDEKTMSSCNEFWAAGYRENGSYKLVDGSVECQFNVQGVDVLTNLTIVEVHTLIHDAYIHYMRPQGNSFLLWVENPALDRLQVDQLCKQKVVQTCEPDLLKLAKHDGIYENKLYDACVCKMAIIFYHTLYSKTMTDFLPCSLFDDPTTEKNETLQQPYILVFLNTINTRHIRYILQPVVCSTVVTLPMAIACEHSHHVIDTSRRCLYYTDYMGQIYGCRSLSHLQDCETFQCPIDYVKCPNSFCVALKHICDGTKNCPGGQDENNCWCKEIIAEVVIMFHTEDIDENTKTAIFNLAKQLYTSSEKVRVLQISTMYSTNDIPGASDDFFVSDETIDLDYERLNKYTSDNYTVSSNDLVNHIRNSFTKKYAGNSIIIIQDKKPLMELLQFINEAPFDTLYYVVEIDETISKKVEFTKESGIIEIKIRKFGTGIVIDPFLFKDLCKEPVSSACKNMYKCASSRVCIHLNQVCDEDLDCPYGDDEYNCQFTCPNKCTCKGLIVDCMNVQFQLSDFMTISSESRALDVSYNIEVDRVYFETEMQYLYSLNFSYSGIQVVDRTSFSKLRNLKILDISYNKLQTIPTDTFKDFKALATLYLFGNSLLTSVQQGAFNGLTAIRELTITGTRLHTIGTGTFAGLQLSKLDLSSNQITTIEDRAFNNLEVETIDISRSDITNFDKDMFTGVRGLHVIHSNAFKFCCIRPSTVQDVDCHPYRDEFSSCEDLMRNNVLQALLWVIGICALLGNGMSLAYRFMHDRQRLKLGYGIFVTNLSIADFMMGIYLLIIAIADTIYRDRYIWNDYYWRNSVWCSIAGVLSTVASEASVLFVCLITLDRLLVIKFPFGQIRFKTKSAILCSILCWLLVVCIAVFPLIHTEYFQNQFYTKAGVCLALPLTRDRPPGWQYSVAIFIGFNFATFLLIAISQWLIYTEINRSRMRFSNKSQSRRNDLKIARNLLLVVTTDFLCWFPIGCMGLMALSGHVIPGDVYAWAAVLILPINSAINPFLYTLTAVLNKRKFLPSVDEQSRTNMGSTFSDYGKGIMSMLDSRFFRQPTTGMGAMSTSLEDYIEHNYVTTREVLKIAVQLTCGIRYLHICELVLGKFDTKNFVAVTLIERQVIDYVQLQTKPSLCTNNIQKVEDIYCLGVIIRKLLNNNKKEQF